ncbi:DNA-binding protein [Levilactobacillus brevis]|uniref:DNA-binding protein n=1 Tax=Levilactobacillus brevis TaxID=1580 RepID=UPI001BDF2018|nr:DNA-binding protein [Levilactobacillus brevis]
MTIKYVAAEDTEAQWGDKKAIMRRYEGLNIYTLNRWLTEMRDIPKFRKGVINPTHKLVWINFEVFGEFLLWKQHVYLK